MQNKNSPIEKTQLSLTIGAFNAPRKIKEPLRSKAAKEETASLPLCCFAVHLILQGRFGTTAPQG